MATYFKVEKVADVDGVVELKIGFGEAAKTPQIVVDAVEAIRSLNLTGGKLVKFDGPCALPIAMALAHSVAHLFGAVACCDPKIHPKYVVCISHDPTYPVGSQLA